MDQRSLLAYGLILLIVLGCAAAWWRFSRDWRGDRRAQRHGERLRRQRRDERIADESRGQ